MLQVYAWGCGPCLGDGSCSSTALKPKLIEELLTVKVVDLTCGEGHCVALTSGTGTRLLV